MSHPRAAVLVLHGGQSTSERPARPWQLAALRMNSVERAVAAQLPAADVLVARVGYRVRGWNGDRADAAQDALRALDALTELAGPVPTVLLGHSMGGRAALRAAGHPQVRGVVALAPWWPPGSRSCRRRGAMSSRCTENAITSPPLRKRRTAYTGRGTKARPGRAWHSSPTATTGCCAATASGTT
ncbi:lysophospholipase [Streptomyces sp. AD2-2]|nr:lysophospholipase [Streptomyces sp. AD2-2]